jgi:hypothetical protein
MELFGILLSGLIALISPANFAGEAIVAQQLKHQFVAVEDLAVRIDNTPSYQIMQGKIDQVRIAGKGLFPLADCRIERLEVETDPIALQGLKTKLAQPLQAGIKLVITEQDLNRALQSPKVIEQLKQFGEKAFGAQATAQIARYTIINPQVTFLGAQRLRIEVELKEQGYPDSLKLKIETDITLESGRSIQLTNTDITTNDQPLYPPLTRRLVAGLNQQLNLDRLEKFGLTARLLKLDFSQQQAEIAVFVQVRPEAQLLQRQRRYRASSARLN